MIPYNYVIYKNSVLATIVGLLGTLCFIAGATFMINMEFVFGIALMTLTVVFSVFLAPYIAERKEKKKEGKYQPISFGVWTAGFFKKALILTLCFAVLIGACVITINVKDADIAEQQSAKTMLELEYDDSIYGKYIKDEVASFMGIFAYEGNSEEKANEYFAMIILGDDERSWIFPISVPPKYRDKIMEISDDYYEFIFSDEVMPEYKGEFFELFAKFEKISSMEKDAYNFYVEELEFLEATDMKANAYLKIVDPNSSASSIYVVIMAAACAALVAMAALAAIGFINNKKIKEENKKEL